MKTKNVILLSLLLSTATVFAVETERERVGKKTKSGHHRGYKKYAYDPEKEKRGANLTREEVRDIDDLREETARETENNSVKPTEPTKL